MMSCLIKGCLASDRNPKAEAGTGPNRLCELVSVQVLSLAPPRKQNSALKIKQRTSDHFIKLEVLPIPMFEFSFP